MSPQYLSRTASEDGGFTSDGFRVVHVIIRGKNFNLAKAKAAVMSLSLVNYAPPTHTVEQDAIALAG